MQVLRRVVTHGFEIEAFKNIQHLYQHHAARAGWRHADNLVAAITATNRLPLNRLIFRQVLSRDDAAISRHELGKALRILALVKTIPALLLNQFESMCQIRLHPGIAQLVARTILPGKLGRRSGVAGKSSAVAAESGLQRIGDWNAFPCQLHCWSKQICPGQGPPILVCLIESCHRARHTDGENAYVIRIANDSAIQSQIHTLGSSQRCFLSEIIGSRIAVFSVVNQETTAADIAARWPCHRQHECRRNSRVDGIAALLQRLHASLGSEPGNTAYDSIFHSQRSSTTFGEGSGD